MNRLYRGCRILTGCCLAAACALVGCKTDEEEENRGTKVLMIGNSFSVSVMANLPKIAEEGGVELDLASLAIGGASLKRHCDNVKKDGWKDYAPYDFVRNRFGQVSRKKFNLCDALRLVKWDVVTIQQASHASWRPETYEPYGTNLIAKIHELAPQAEVVVQEPWSYTPWDARLKLWGIDQKAMYARIHETVGEFSRRHSLKVIPTGTAVEEWRRRRPVKYTENSFGNDVVGGRYCKERDLFMRRPDNRWEPKCDVFHLNEKGEYLQALVWAVTLLDIDPMDIEHKPKDVSEQDAMLMKSVAVGVK